MNPKQQLARDLLSESKAYGYTLIIWGGGTLLFNQYGTPGTVEVFSYIGGALAAFTLLTVFAFDHLFADQDTTGNQQLAAASMIHIAATFGNLLVGYLLLRALAVYAVPAVGAFLLIGFQLTLAYNLLLLVETALVKAIAEEAGA